VSILINIQRWILHEEQRYGFVFFGREKIRHSEAWGSIVKIKNTKTFLKQDLVLRYRKW
jgi:hypothetical protein